MCRRLDLRLNILRCAVFIALVALLPGVRIRITLAAIVIVLIVIWSRSVMRGHVGAIMTRVSPNVLICLR